MRLYQRGITRGLVTAITGAALGLGLTACGDDEEERSKRALSKRQYIARSNAICERTQKKAGKVFERIVGEEGPPAPGEEQAYLRKATRFLEEGAIPIISENLAGRRALPAPAGDEQQIAAINSAGAKAVAGFKEIAEDPAKVESLFRGKLADPAKRWDALSRAYGIEKCGGD